MQSLTILLGHLAVSLLATAGVDAAPACRVELVPADAPNAWVSAARSLQRALRAAPAGDRDCREIVIRATPDHASVEVTTLDGRRGVRLLSDAREVESTVTALIVTVPDDVVVERSSPAAAQVRWQPLLTASGGGRLTLPGTPAPVVDVTAGVLHRSWELALYGAWSPTVLGTAASAQASFSSTTELGLAVARRHPFRLGDLLFGGRVGAIRLSPNSSDVAQTGNVDDSFAGTVGPAVSAFIGTSTPVLSFLRVRTQLSLQWVPPLRVSGTNAASSTWSVGLSLGAESRIP